MKKRGMRNFFILFTIIVIILTNGSSALAQPQNGHQPQGFFHLQFVFNVSWSDNDTQEPISPGETREVNLTVTTCVTRGAYGRWLLQLLEGRPFPIRVSIEDKPDWCTAWISPENITGIIQPDQVLEQPSLLYIHLNDDAPSNYTSGWVKIHGSINDKKGPFNIFTLVNGYEQNYTIEFTAGP